MNCIRCGRSEKIENHHIKPKSEGGGDDAENKEPRCSACHHCEHAKLKILATLEKERRRKQFKRVAVLEYRLEVLEKLNTPGLIRERGYQTWWIDESIHEYPPYEKVKRDSEIASERCPQIVMKLEV